MLEIITYPAKILRTVARPVVVFDDNLANLAANMAEAMLAADGVGLAAVQVDQDLSLFVKREKDKDYKVFVNPKITYYSSDKEMSEEGCLSIPGVFGILPRSKKIHLKYQDLAGKTHKETIKGFAAIVCQHEVDHLNGVLFVDHVNQLTKGSELWEKMNNDESR